MDSNLENRVKYEYGWSFNEKHVCAECRNNGPMDEFGVSSLWCPLDLMLLPRCIRTHLLTPGGSNIDGQGWELKCGMLRGITNLT